MEERWKGEGREGSRRGRQKQETGRTQRRAEMRLRAEGCDKAVWLSVLAQGSKSSVPRAGGGVRSCPREGPWEGASREGSCWPREERSGPSGELLCVKQCRKESHGHAHANSCHCTRPDTKSAILAYLQILMKQKSSHNQRVHTLIKKNYELI